MNFYTFNFDAHHRYVLWLLVLAFVPAIALFALGVFLEPLYGDLTRIGGYAERSYGWSRPQLEFSKPLYTIDKYTRYHDVVVLGDSFSRAWPLQQWQNYVVAATDLSVVTLNINALKLDNVIRSRVFREMPPKFFVLESVEREFPARLKDQPPCGTSDLPQQIPMVKPHLVHTESMEKFAEYVERKTVSSDVKLGFVLKYLWYGAWRNLAGAEKSDARMVELAVLAPFSSLNRKEMLVYKDDFKKVMSPPEMGLVEMGCRIERIRKNVEANGKTRFVLLVAPDKLTAYADLIGDKALRNVSELGRLSEQHPKVIPRTDLALTSAIHSGELDVYLPDDTHWGSNGHRIAAETLLDFLREPE